MVSGWVQASKQTNTHTRRNESTLVCGGSLRLIPKMVKKCREGWGKEEREGKKRDRKGKGEKEGKEDGDRTVT